jgi:hypothetical protein
MSFLRHARSIGPMWVLTSRKAQPGYRLPLVGTGNPHKGATEIAPLLIVRDESHRLSLGGLLSSRACLRFAGCAQFAMKEYGRSRNFQRTANSVLTVCVSRGDKRIVARSGTHSERLYHDRVSPQTKPRALGTTTGTAVCVLGLAETFCGLCESAVFCV